jgi:hypothetical protein
MRLSRLVRQNIMIPDEIPFGRKPVAWAMVNEAATTRVRSASEAPTNVCIPRSERNVSRDGHPVLSLPRGALVALVMSCILSAACHGHGLSSRIVVTTPPSGTAAVLTYHNDNARTGQNLDETILTTANVNSKAFGQVGMLSVDGLVDAEPLYVSSLIGNTAHNVVFVATEHDSVYAFDADKFSLLWKVSLLGANETSSDPVNGCGQVFPEIGITAAPVIDPKAGTHGTIFVVAMSKDASGNYHQRLHALDLAAGTEQTGSPTVIAASYPGTGDNSKNGHVIFDPMQYEERVGLLLLNGTIYMGWTSHCDIEPYTGWIMGYSESTLKQTSVIDVTPNGSEGSIWMSGAGLAADSSSNLYFLVANGTFDGTLNANGQPASGDYGNAFVKLSTTGGNLAVADYFTMFDTSTESGEDEDLGSGGAVLLPDLKDNSGNTWQLAVGSGKDGSIYVVNRNMMGGMQIKEDNQIYQEIDGQLTEFQNGGGVWSMPAYFNNAVYYGAVGDSVKAFTISSATLSASPTSRSGNSFGYPGTTPSISANGNTDGIVWAIENGSTGVLHAYDATNVASELYNSNMAGARGQFSTTTNCKFVTPMIANGKVFVGTAAGVVVFGLLNP